MKNEMRFNECGDIVLPFVGRMENEDNESAKARFYAWKNAKPATGFDYKQFKDRCMAVTSDEIPVLVYGNRRELPEWAVEHHKIHIMTVEESMKRNLLKVDSQTTLDGVIRWIKPLRVVDGNIIKSFGVKPNFLLEKAWLLHLVNGKKLSDTERQLLNARSKVWW